MADPATPPPDREPAAESRWQAYLRHSSEPLFLLLPADRVRFEAVDRTRMAELDAAVASGWRPEPERR